MLQMFDTNKKNLAIIGASYLQLPLIEKAKSMGYITHVFAWKANDVGEDAADFFYPISIIDKEKILDECCKIGICGVCSIASDLAAITANYVADALGLNGNDLNATEKSTNKFLMRAAFKKGGDPSPECYLVDESTDINKLELKYPVIVKPTDRSGSRGICKSETYSETVNAVKVAVANSFEKKALIEEFVFGKEYSVEYISYAGKHYFLAVTEKFTTGAPHFIETGHLEPAPLDDKTVRNIRSVVEHALDTLGIRNSASHSEVKIDSDGTIKIIEIGGRMGGDCIGSDLVYYSTGVDFLKCVIQVACGEEPDLTPKCDKCTVKCEFIFTYSDLEKFQKLKAENPSKILKVVDYHPENIGKTTDSSNRAGCYIIKVN